MGRTLSPRALKRAANRWGYDVINGIIGVGSRRGGGGDGDAGGWRFSGSERTSGTINGNERRSRSVKVAIRYSERANTWCESCKDIVVSTKINMEQCACVSRNGRAYLFRTSRS